MYTVGDVIYPEGDVDNSKWYRLEVRDASNVLRSSFACTPTSRAGTSLNAQALPLFVVVVVLKDASSADVRL
jgi:hypothetical protein